MKGAVIMPRTDEDFVRVKHYLISRGQIFKTIFVDTGAGDRRPLVMTDMSLYDRLLFYLNFGNGSVVFK